MMVRSLISSISIKAEGTNLQLVFQGLRTFWAWAVSLRTGTGPAMAVFLL